MRVFIVGGGPGGLYAGLLLKKANPSFDIHLVERNPADATYGWGVVFSDRTLSNFRDADAKTYQEITDNFVIWPAIDTHYRGQLIRCEGHSFAGISRRLLLEILQERCRELGIGLTFEKEVSDFSSFGDYDLVIAADGVNSFIRSAYADAFQPSLTPGKAKFIWLGTDKVLDSFTFIFRENEHGLFQVHAYPFEGETSTFIVECDEDVWRRAGLDQAGEAESIAYCQALFADFLKGRRLLSNKSEWINFITVRNRTWRHKNIVLLGDSAHTAHFSVGSGTKLAMEDAIALAEAFETTSDLETALNRYEMERRPRVEALQEAARESRVYFENIKRYLDLDPIQFTTNLLTRSGRINYDNLRVRDPYYVDAVDRRFPGEDDPDPTPLVAPRPMLRPLQLNGLTLTNRVVVSPPASYEAADGTLSPGQEDQLRQQAQRGTALLLTGATAVSADGRITPGCPGMYEEGHLDVWQRLVRFVHETTATRIGLQLNHAGRRGATQPRHFGLDRPLRQGGWPLLSASAIPYHETSQTPEAMDRDDMDRVRQSFVRAAEMAQTAGFDMLQLHFGHGYLLASFISPLTNERQDEYGGELGNRLRYPLQVFDAVRAVWPPEKPLSVALTATDWAKGGSTPEDAVVVAEALKERGCRLVQPLAGQTTLHVRPAYGAGFLTSFSEQIRHQAGIATMVGGYLTTSGEVNSILAAGRADLCIMEA